MTFPDWLKFRLVDELTYEIDVRFQEKFMTNDTLCLILSSAFRTFFVGSFFKAIHFHICYTIYRYQATDTNLFSTFFVN
jgi:hypothetical protein